MSHAAGLTKGSQLNEYQCLNMIQNPDFAENLSVFLQNSSVWTNNTSTQDNLPGNKRQIKQAMKESERNQIMQFGQNKIRDKETDNLCQSLGAVLLD